MDKVPILKLYGYLLISIQTDIHDLTIQALQEDILTTIRNTGARGVLIDISALDIVDSFMARTLRDTVLMARLLGAYVVITGIQPAVAITLVDLGLNPEYLYTATDVNAGFELLHDLVADEDSRRYEEEVPGYDDQQD
ncbi:MAG: STAS domain-containing protein [Methanomicrobiales archaeon]